MRTLITVSGPCPDEPGAWTMAYLERDDGDVEWRCFEPALWAEHDVAAEPRRRCAHPTLDEAFAHHFTDEGVLDISDLAVELEGATEDDLTQALCAAHAAGTTFVLNGEETGFDGADLVHPAIVTNDLRVVADEAREVWRRHEVRETGAPVTWEVNQAIVELRGIYFFLDRGDSDPRVEKLGRYASADDAIAAASKLI